MFPCLLVFINLIYFHFNHFVILSFSYFLILLPIFVFKENYELNILNVSFLIQYYQDEILSNSNFYFDLIF